jgi:hypothetical protein
MTLDKPIFDIRHRIKYWIHTLSDEQRAALRMMNPEESLRSMLEGLEGAPPLIGRAS